MVRAIHARHTQSHERRGKKNKNTIVKISRFSRGVWIKIYFFIHKCSTEKCREFSPSAIHVLFSFYGNNPFAVLIFIPLPRSLLKSIENISRYFFSFYIAIFPALVRVCVSRPLAYAPADRSQTTKCTIAQAQSRGSLSAASYHHYQQRISESH